MSAYPMDCVNFVQESGLGRQLLRESVADPERASQACPPWPGMQMS